jgi:methionyl-tRNA synthetase
MKMATTNLEKSVEVTPFRYDQAFIKNMESFNIQKATELIWLWVGELDAIIQEKEPFKLVKTDPEKAKKIISNLVDRLANIASHLASILPETSEKILNLIHNHKNPETPLFLRKE